MWSVSQPFCNSRNLIHLQNYDNYPSLPKVARFAVSAAPDTSTPTPAPESCTTAPTLNHTLLLLPRKGVYAGKVMMTFRLTLRNPSTAVAGLDLVLTLPQGMSVVKAMVLPRNKQTPKPVADGSTIMWANATVRGKRHTKFQAKFKVASNVPRGTQLTFQTMVFPTGTDAGTPYCPYVLPDAQVRV